MSRFKNEKNWYQTPTEERIEKMGEILDDTTTCIAGNEYRCIWWEAKNTRGRVSYIDLYRNGKLLAASPVRGTKISKFYLHEPIMTDKIFIRKFLGMKSVSIGIQDPENQYKTLG